MRSPAILNSQPAIGMQLFDYDTGAAAATDMNLVGPGQGGGYTDLLALDPRITNTHNSDFSVNINKHNMLPNPDFIISGGTVGIIGSSTGTVPLYYGAYNPGSSESCAFSYNSSAGCPVGNGGAWQLTYSNNANLKGLYVGSSTGYGGFKLKANSTYIFSVYVSTTWNDVNNYSGQWGLNFDTGGVTYTINNTGGTGIQQYYTSDTNWYWINFVLTVGSSPYTGNIYLYNQYNPSGTSQTCYIGCMKLEEGQVASGWTGAVYETGITDFKLPHNNKVLDNIPDGTTRAGILVTQLAGSAGAYTVKQLYDGTYTRTAAQIAGAIDTSSRLIGNIYDGTTALTPANFTNAINTSGLLKVANSTGTLPRANTDSSITSAIDSSSRLITSIYDGTTAISAANVTNVITTGGLVKVANATGNLPYTNNSTAITAVISSGSQLNISPSGGVTGSLPRANTDTSFTTAVDSSGRVIGSIYDGTTSITPANVTNAISNTGLVKVANATGNIPYTNESTAVKSAVDSSSRIIGNIYDGTTSLTPGNITNVITTGGLVKVANATGNLPRANTDSSITTAIDASSRLLTSIYDGTTAITAANITNVITTGGLVKVANATGTLPYSNLATAITGVISSGGQLNIAPTGGVTGTLPYSNNSSAFTMTVNSSGNLLPNPFGSSSGVTFNNSDYTLSGFSASGVSTIEQFPTLIACYVSADIMPSSTSGTIELGIGSTTNGYSIKWVSSGSSGTCFVYRYVLGTASTVNVIGTQGPFTPSVYNRLRIVVDFYNQQIEAVIEQEGAVIAGVLTPQSDVSGPWANFGSSVPIWINAGGTSGKVQNLEINPRDCFLQNNQFIISTIDGSNTGHWLQAATVDTRALQAQAVTALKISNNCITASQMAGFPGSANVTYDNIPTGSTYGPIKLSGMTSGIVSQTENTVFGAGIFEGTDGSWTGFSNSGSSTIPVLTIGVGHVVSFSLEFELSATGAAQYWVLGNSTNGYGLTWQVAGGLNISKWTSGTRSTLASLTTVTQDTNIHSLEITVTCVSTSSVKIECVFDNQAPVIFSDVSALNLTSGTWPITIMDGNNGTTKVWNFLLESTQATYSSLPIAVQDVITSAGALTTTAKSSVLNLINHSGTSATSAVVVSDTALLSFASSALATVTITLTTGYSGAGSYVCVATPQFTASLPSTTLCSIFVAQTSGTSITLHGVLSAATTSTISVTVNYVCIPV